MAEVSKSGTPTPSTVGASAGERLGDYYADVDVKAGDACRLTGQRNCTLSSGAANDATSAVHGWAGHDANAGQNVTLWTDINIGYGAKSDANLVPPQNLYLSATVPGGLSTSATTGGTVPCAFAAGSGRIRVRQVIK